MGIVGEIICLVLQLWYNKFPLNILHAKSSAGGNLTAGTMRLISYGETVGLTWSSFFFLPLSKTKWRINIRGRYQMCHSTMHFCSNYTVVCILLVCSLMRIRLIRSESISCQTPVRIKATVLQLMPGQELSSAQILYEHPIKPYSSFHTWFQSLI